MKKSIANRSYNNGFNDIPAGKQIEKLKSLTLILSTDII